jgi:signal transduction histidine kinase
MVLLSNHNHQPGQYVPASQRTNAMPVKANGKVVGTVFADGPPPALSPSDAQFLASTERALIFGSLAAFLLALGLGILLARSLTRPVREITTALHAMAGGELQQAVPVRSQDELGELSAAFNQMSTDLAYANQQRRQMTADIAHDLRTPVTVIAGYLEALRDGVLPPTPERFGILYEESQHLQALIEDLRTLSLADAGELVLHPQTITPQALLQRIAEIYRHPAEQSGEQRPALHACLRHDHPWRGTWHAGDDDLRAGYGAGHRATSSASHLRPLLSRRCVTGAVAGGIWTGISHRQSFSRGAWGNNRCGKPAR